MADVRGNVYIYFPDFSKRKIQWDIYIDYKPKSGATNNGTNLENSQGPI